MKVYDATNQIVGRFSTVIAKELLRGETIHVVNAEKAVVAGNPKYTKQFYLKRIHRGDPVHGPLFPKQPNGILKRTVRGMLPYKKAVGQKAFKRLKVWVSLPDEFKKHELIKLKESDASKLRTKSITLGELSLELGGKKRW